MMKEYGKKYKTAVEQIKLSDADRQELLEAVREGKSAAAKRKKMPFYLGSAAAAALLVLVIAGNNRLFFPDSRENEGMENGRSYGSTQSDTDDTLNKFGTQAAGSSQDMMMSIAAEPVDEADDCKEAEGGADGAAEKNTSDGIKAGASVFYIMAYDEDIGLLDEGEGENNIESNTSQESFPAAGDGGIVLGQGKSYGAYSMEAPSCDIAMFADDGNACDSYRIRVAGGALKPAAEAEEKEGWSKELQVKDGERVSIKVTDEFGKDEALWSSEAGMEEDVWQDEEIVTVTQVLIEAVKDGKAVDSQKIYVGMKGERYYGVVQ